MSIFSSIGNFFSDLSKVAKGGEASYSHSGVASKLINSGAVLAQSFNIGGLLGNLPKPTVNKEIVKNKGLQTIATTIVQHPYLSTAAAVAPFTSIGKSIGTSALGFAAKNPKLAAAGGLLALPVLGAVIREPTAAFNAAVQTPSSLVNFGGNVASFAANPTVNNAKSIFKENPIISSIAGAAGIAAIGGGLGLAANTAATILNTHATNTDTLSSPVDIGNTSNTFIPSTTNLPTTGGDIIPTGNNSGKLQTSPILGTGSQKRASYKKQQPVKISNRVNVYNRNINKEIESNIIEVKKSGTRYAKHYA